MDQILEEGDNGSIEGAPNTITFNTGVSPINPKLQLKNNLRSKVDSRGALYNNGSAVMNMQSPGTGVTTLLSGAPSQTVSERELPFHGLAFKESNTIAATNNLNKSDHSNGGISAFGVGGISTATKSRGDTRGGNTSIPVLGTNPSRHANKRNNQLDDITDRREMEDSMEELLNL